MVLSCARFTWILVGAVIPAVLILAYILSVNAYKGIPVPVLLLAVVAMVMVYIANNTRFGRYAYAIGGNREAARLSGINITSVLFRVFILMGFLCGVAGVVLASYVGYGTIAAGTGYELDAIAACILGGTSPLGGVGTIPGALIGALIIASLTNGMQMMNFAPGLAVCRESDHPGAGSAARRLLQEDPLILRQDQMVRRD